MSSAESLTSAMFHILLALADGPEHGYAIMQDIAQRTDGQVDLGPGTLYRSIGKLLNSGMIDEHPESDDDRRRPYRITAAGRKAVAAEARRLAMSVEWARAAKVLKDVG